mgnify:CR=1 FL=1
MVISTIYSPSAFESLGLEGSGAESLKDNEPLSLTLNKSLSAPPVIA